MIRRIEGVRIEWFRRAVQLTSLTAFVVLTVGAPLYEWGWLPAQLFSRLDPLVGLTAVIASRTWFEYASLGLLTLAFTVLLGRVWCGWVCPVGTLLDVVPARRGPKGSRNPRLPDSLKLGKYGVLIVVVGAAVFGTLAPMVLDPVTIAMRPLQELAKPAVGSDAVGLSVGSYLSRTTIADVAYLSVALLVAVLALNAAARRFWCRSLCPLGGLLAVTGRSAFVRRSVNATLCTSCGKCARECGVSAIDKDRAYTSSPSDCVTCMRCVDVCPRSAASFDLRRPSLRLPDYVPERREAIAFFGATGVAIATTLALPSTGNAAEIARPPSTDEERLAQRCVRCGACYSACPTGVLRPSTSVTSRSGLWTPMLEVRPRYCTLNCNLCADVCPTDALHVLTPDESAALGLGGAADVDRSRCIAWGYGRDCMRCQGVCPISGAIQTRHETVTDRWGHPKNARVPVVDYGLCIACGLCSEACPTMPPAIMVVRV